MPHVFVGPHPDVLGSGKPLTLDQVVEDGAIDPLDAHDRALIAKGWLIPQPRPVAGSRRKRRATSSSTNQEA